MSPEDHALLEGVAGTSLVRVTIRCCITSTQWDRVALFCFDHSIEEFFDHEQPLFHPPHCKPLAVLTWARCSPTRESFEIHSGARCVLVICGLDGSGCPSLEGPLWTSQSLLGWTAVDTLKTGLQWLTILPQGVTACVPENTSTAGISVLVEARSAAEGRTDLSSGEVSRGGVLVSQWTSHCHEGLLTTANSVGALRARLAMTCGPRQRVESPPLLLDTAMGLSGDVVLIVEDLLQLEQFGVCIHVEVEEPTAATGWCLRAVSSVLSIDGLMCGSRVVLTSAENAQVVVASCTVTIRAVPWTIPYNWDFLRPTCTDLPTPPSGAPGFSRTFTALCRVRTVVFWSLCTVPAGAPFPIIGLAVSGGRGGSCGVTKVRRIRLPLDEVGACSQGTYDSYRSTAVFAFVGPDLAVAHGVATFSPLDYAATVPSGSLWLAIRNASSDVCGAMLLEYQIVQLEDVRSGVSSVDGAPTIPSLESPSDFLWSTVRIEVVEARGLRHRGLGSSCSAYCTVALLPLMPSGEAVLPPEERLESYHAFRRTHTARNTSNPQWDAVFVFYDVVPHAQGLFLRVVDENTAVSDNVIGCVSLHHSDGIWGSENGSVWLPFDSIAGHPTRCDGVVLIRWSLSGRRETRAGVHIAADGAHLAPPARPRQALSTRIEHGVVYWPGRMHWGNSCGISFPGPDAVYALRVSFPTGGDVMIPLTCPTPRDALLWMADSVSTEWLWGACSRTVTLSLVVRESTATATEQVVATHFLSTYEMACLAGEVAYVVAARLHVATAHASCLVSCEEPLVRFRAMSTCTNCFEPAASRAQTGVASRRDDGRGCVAQHPWNRPLKHRLCVSLQVRYFVEATTAGRVAQLGKTLLAGVALVLPRSERAPPACDMWDEAVPCTGEEFLPLDNGTAHHAQLQLPPEALTAAELAKLYLAVHLYDVCTQGKRAHANQAARQVTRLGSAYASIAGHFAAPNGEHTLRIACFEKVIGWLRLHYAHNLVDRNGRQPAPPMLEAPASAEADDSSTMRCKTVVEVLEARYLVVPSASEDAILTSVVLGYGETQCCSTQPRRGLNPLFRERFAVGWCVGGTNANGSSLPSRIRLQLLRHSPSDEEITCIGTAHVHLPQACLPGPLCMWVPLRRPTEPVSPSPLIAVGSREDTEWAGDVLLRVTLPSLVACTNVRLGDLCSVGRNRRACQVLDPQRPLETVAGVGPAAATLLQVMVESLEGEILPRDTLTEEDASVVSAVEVNVSSSRAIVPLRWRTRWTPLRAHETCWAESLTFPVVGDGVAVQFQLRAGLQGDNSVMAGEVPGDLETSPKEEVTAATTQLSLAATLRLTPEQWSDVSQWCKFSLELKSNGTACSGMVLGHPTLRVAVRLHRLPFHQDPQAGSTSSSAPGESGDFPYHVADVDVTPSMLLWSTLHTRTANTCRRAPELHLTMFETPSRRTTMKLLLYGNEDGTEIVTRFEPLRYRVSVMHPSAGLARLIHPESGVCISSGVFVVPFFPQPRHEPILSSSLGWPAVALTVELMPLTSGCVPGYSYSTGTLQLSLKDASAGGSQQRGDALADEVHVVEHASTTGSIPLVTAVDSCQSMRRTLVLSAVMIAGVVETLSPEVVSEDQLGPEASENESRGVMLWLEAWTVGVPSSVLRSPVFAAPQRCAECFLAQSAAVDPATVAFASVVVFDNVVGRLPSPSCTRAALESTSSTPTPEGPVTSLKNSGTPEYPLPVPGDVMIHVKLMAVDKGQWAPFEVPSTTEATTATPKVVASGVLEVGAPPLLPPTNVVSAPLAKWVPLSLSVDHTGDREDGTASTELLPGEGAVRLHATWEYAIRGGTRVTCVRLRSARREELVQPFLVFVIAYHGMGSPSVYRLPLLPSSWAPRGVPPDSEKESLWSFASVLLPLCAAGWSAGTAMVTEIQLWSHLGHAVETCMGVCTLPTVTDMTAWCPLHEPRWVRFHRGSTYVLPHEVLLGAEYTESQRDLPLVATRWACKATLSVEVSRIVLWSPCTIRDAGDAATGDACGTELLAAIGLAERDGAAAPVWLAAMGSGAPVINSPQNSVASDGDSSDGDDRRTGGPSRLIECEQQQRDVNGAWIATWGDQRPSTTVTVNTDVWQHRSCLETPATLDVYARGSDASSSTPCVIASSRFSWEDYCHSLNGTARVPLRDPGGDETGMAEVVWAVKMHCAPGPSESSGVSSPGDGKPVTTCARSFAPCCEHRQSRPKRPPQAVVRTVPLVRVRLLEARGLRWAMVSRRHAAAREDVAVIAAIQRRSARGAREYRMGWGRCARSRSGAPLGTVVTFSQEARHEHMAVPDADHFPSTQRSWSISLSRKDLERKGSTISIWQSLSPSKAVLLGLARVRFSTLGHASHGVENCAEGPSRSKWERWIPLRDREERRSGAALRVQLELMPPLDEATSSSSGAAPAADAALCVGVRHLSIPHCCSKNSDELTCVFAWMAEGEWRLSTTGLLLRRAETGADGADAMDCLTWTPEMALHVAGPFGSALQCDRSAAVHILLCAKRHGANRWRRWYDAPPWSDIAGRLGRGWVVLGKAQLALTDEHAKPCSTRLIEISFGEAAGKEEASRAVLHATVMWCTDTSMVAPSALCHLSAPLSHSAAHETAAETVVEALPVACLSMSCVVDCVQDSVPVLGQCGCVSSPLGDVYLFGGMTSPRAYARAVERVTTTATILRDTACADVGAGATVWRSRVMTVPDAPQWSSVGHVVVSLGEYGFLIDGGYGSWLPATDRARSGHRHALRRFQRRVSPSTWRYVPQKGVGWIELPTWGAARHPRSFHSAIALADSGHVICFGGWSTASAVCLTGDAAAVDVTVGNDDEIAVSEGPDGPWVLCSDLRSLDVYTNEWTVLQRRTAFSPSDHECPPQCMPPPLAAHTAVRFGQKMIVFGGQTDSGVTLDEAIACHDGSPATNAVYVLDLDSLQWEARLPPPSGPTVRQWPAPRFGHCAVRVGSSSRSTDMWEAMMVFGGDRLLDSDELLWQYDVRFDLWTRVTVHHSVPLTSRFLSSLVVCRQRRVPRDGDKQLRFKQDDGADEDTGGEEEVVLLVGGGGLPAAGLAPRRAFSEASGFAMVASPLCEPLPAVQLTVRYTIATGS